MKTTPTALAVEVASQVQGGVPRPRGTVGRSAVLRAPRYKLFWPNGDTNDFYTAVLDLLLYLLGSDAPCFIGRWQRRAIVQSATQFLVVFGLIPRQADATGAAH